MSKNLFQNGTLCALCFFLSVIVETGINAGESNSNHGSQASNMVRSNIPQKEGRQKFIDFDGDLVEGMNKSPYDSLNQVSESQRKRRAVHLYRKRKGFPMEIQHTLKKMRYIQ